eukprot:COSAG06_NODE_136_length_22390_cov_14.138711_11_plen_120_part_00
MSMQGRSRCGPADPLCRSTNWHRAPSCAVASSAAPLAGGKELRLRAAPQLPSVRRSRDQVRTAAGYLFSVTCSVTCGAFRSVAVQYMVSAELQEFRVLARQQARIVVSLLHRLEGNGSI